MTLSLHPSADDSREENAWLAVDNFQQSGPSVHKHTVYQCGYGNPEEAEDENPAEVDETNVSRTREADDADKNCIIYHRWVAGNGG
jgi:hypothetical protein